MKKRIISLLLAVVMIVGMIPLGAITASAAEQQYPIKITDYATYSDMTIDMSGKTVEHIFEIKDCYDHPMVTFRNITFMNVSGTGDGSCVYINSENYVLVAFINCRFINCSASGNGGAVCVQNMGVTVGGKKPFVLYSDCYAVNCRAGGDGGFMYVNDADATVYGEKFLGKVNDGVPQLSGEPSTVISGCTAGDDGGAIYMELGKQIDGFLLSDNTASSGDGGGICNTSNSAAVSNCRFYRNYAKVDGGGLYTDGSTVENCKFFENECSGDGCGLYSYFSSTKINNCTFTGSHTAEYEVKNGELSNCSFLTKDNYWLSSGDGSQGNPYVIKTTDDWDALHYMALKRQRVIYSDGTEKVFNDDYCLYGKYIRLDADIIVCNTVGEVHDYAPLGGAVLYTSYSEFNGIFDGNGHTVTYVSYIGSDRNGVFGYANSATVKNLTVNGYVGGRNRVGGLFGSTYNCTAENCTNNAFVYGTNDCVGGIAGHSECSNYIGCTNNGKVEGAHGQIGGIVGYSNGDTINGCVNNGAVVGLQKCGGIVGVAHETDSLINGEHRAPKILNCINNATVTATYSYGGGIIGYEDGKVTAENCINTGKVNADATAERYPAEGDYVIYAASDNKYCFDIQGGAEGLENYRNLQLWTAQTSGAKVFTLKYYDKYDAYAIIAKHSGLALTADPKKDYSTVDLVNVYQFTNQPVRYQLWTFEPGNAGSYKIRSLESGFTMNVANGTACEGASIIAYKYGGNDSFKLVAEPNQVLKSFYANGITGRHFDGSSYENCFYDKEKAIGDRYGIGLSTNAMRGVSADIIDEKEYIMPNILNDDIIENAPGTQNYLPVYFDDNNILSVAHSIDENSLTLGESGKTTAYCATKAETVFNDRVTVKGNVILFLRDGSILTAQKGITLENGNTLTVYGSEDTEKAGKLIATAETNSGNAGIGGIRGKDGAGDPDDICDSGTPGTSAGTLRVYGGYIYVSGTVGFGGGLGGNAYPGNPVVISGSGGDGGSGGTLELFGGNFEAFGTDCAVGGGKGGYASGGGSMIPDLGATMDGNTGTPTVISYEPNIVLYAGEKTASEIVSNGKMCQDKKYFKVKYTDVVAVDCISALNGGYIDTTYQPNENTRVVMDVLVNSSTESWFGVWDIGFNSSVFALGNDGDGVYAGYGNQGKTDTAGALPNGRHTVELNKSKVYIDGEERTSFEFTDSSEGLPTQNPLFLFAENRCGSAYTKGKVTCYGCQIYEDDVLIHNYVPMQDTVTGTGFLYDTVDKNSLRSGTGDMIAHTEDAHNWIEAEQNKSGISALKTAATCTNDAVYYKVCSVCDDISTTETWTKSGTATGSHIDGDGDGRCDGCGRLMETPDVFRLSLSNGKVEDDAKNAGYYKVGWSLGIDLNTESEFLDCDINVLSYGIYCAAGEQTLQDIIDGKTPEKSFIHNVFRQNGGMPLDKVYKTTNYSLTKVSAGKTRYAVCYIVFEIDGDEFVTFTDIDGVTVTKSLIDPTDPEVVTNPDDLQD